MRLSYHYPPSAGMFQATSRRAADTPLFAGASGPSTRLQNGPDEMTALADFFRQASERIRNLKPGERLTIGRYSKNSPQEPDISFPDRPPYDVVSRQQGVFWKDRRGDLWYQDSGSANGTYLNNRTLHRDEQVILRQGDRLAFIPEYHTPYTNSSGVRVFQDVDRKLLIEI